ncbi:hypothetical protein [Flavobacterium sp. C4GT6]|uniref:hypothetical protein n=1 Tax=Flavobacterium sp. C4GT6 TaxID=3103818 RepID=UPI002ED2B189
MKKILLGLSLLLSLCLNAQNINCAIETIDINNSKNFSYYAREVIEKPNGEKLFICDGYRKIVFYTVDEDNNLIKQEKYTIGEDNELISLYTFKNKIYILYIHYDKKTSSIYASSSDIDTLNFTSKKIFTGKVGHFQELKDIDIDYTTPVRSSMVGNALVVSNDHSAFAFCLPPGDTKNDDTKSKLIIYSSETLDPILEHTFNDEDDKKFIYHYKAFTLKDDMKTAILLAKITIRPNNPFSTKTDGYDNRYSHYEIERLTSSGFEKKILTTGSSSPRTLTMIEENDNIKLFGFYSQTNKFRLKGVCFFNIDSNSFSVKSSNFSPISSQLNIDINDKHIYWPDLIKGVHTADNGDNLITFEIRSKVQSNMTGGQNRLIKPYFYTSYGNIYAARIDSEGNLIWLRGIQKSQSGHRGSAHLSFSTLFKDNELYVFLNTEEIKVAKNGRIKISTDKAEDADFTVLKFDAKGNYTYKTLLDHNEVKSYIHPFVGATPNSENSIYFYASKRKQHPSGRVDTYQEIYKIKP